MSREGEIGPSRIGEKPRAPRPDSASGTTHPEALPQAPKNGEGARLEGFLHRIGRSDLAEVLGEETPFSYASMEFYGAGIQGNGGLGVLASDTLQTMQYFGIPSVFLTPFYPKERVQRIENGNQVVDEVGITPEERGFAKSDAVPSVSIKTVHDGHEMQTDLNVYVKKIGSVSLITPTEPNFGALYQGENHSDHRLYQEVALGIGGFEALKRLGVAPSVHQLNEAPTVFSALARLDELLSTPGAKDIAQALSEVRKNTVYTNHTLVQAVEAKFTLDQFERYVFPNIKHALLTEWLMGKIQQQNGEISLSRLALELSGKRNGVSSIHAEEAGKEYKDLDGNPVEFTGVTNGISLERWCDSQLLKYYREKDILDEFYLPAADFQEKIKALDQATLKGIKDRAKIRMRKTLRERKNQRGESVEIPEGAQVINWKRRIAKYKRPGMLFEKPEELANILESANTYLIMAGRAHPSDKLMIEEIKRILDGVESNPILKKRVHFVQDYDEQLALALAQGADISINTPRVWDEEKKKRISTEACGTSWAKDIINNTIVVSTSDGGLADPEVAVRRRGDKSFEAPFFEISGIEDGVYSHEAEIKSLYDNIRKACSLTPEQKAEELQKQLTAFIEIISGSRMTRDYLNLAFPRTSI